MKAFLPDNTYPHGLVIYSQKDILDREYLINRIATEVASIFKGINPVINMLRVETPILTPANYLKSHISVGFELINAGDNYLRPETTRGTFEALNLIYPQSEQLRKALPICIWQVGKSFRNEQTRPFGELRFKEFYQLEFQLVYPEGTKVDYMEKFLPMFKLFLTCLLKQEIFLEEQEKLPHYSKRTVDIYVDRHEIAGISYRMDFDYPVLEIACGLDRLLYLFQ